MPEELRQFGNETLKEGDNAEQEEMFSPVQIPTFVNNMKLLVIHRRIYNPVAKIDNGKN